MLEAFHDYTRCPDSFLTSDPEGGMDPKPAFFRWRSLELFGRTGSTAGRNGLSVPFDPTEVTDNLRLERYIDNRLPGEDGPLTAKAALRKAYYAARPLLPVAVRKHAQRWALKDWSRLTFPSWPVDTTVDTLMLAIFRRLLELHGVDEIPFIWFWPKGRQACAIMTHDVETAAGRDFCGSLMRMEAPHGIKSAFEIVPEERYRVPETFLKEIREAGCEICVHGLNHDGRLFLTESIFRERAPKINDYARRFGAKGFRSPVMYRRVEWYDAFEFSYDMSIPNVAHLDPQRGGCCTVLPYSIGRLVELPLTTTQDYQLFNILKQYNLDLWRQQCEIVLKYHGLMSFIIHPDYMLARQASDVYRRLLEYLVQLREERQVWIALPGEVDTWWRQRSCLRIEVNAGTWTITGEGHESARLAFACRAGDDVVFRLADVSSGEVRRVAKVGI
jgi:hypothetical protein